MFCAHCGSKLAGSSKFCPICGARLETPAVPVAEPAPVVPVAEPVPVAPVAEPISEPVPVAEPVAPVIEPIPVAEPEVAAPKMIFCGHCGGQVEDGAKFCPICGQNPTISSAPEEKAPKKKKLGGLIALFVVLGVVALLAIVAIVGLCTNWFGYYGPATKIVQAARKTVNANSFTIKSESVTKYNYDGDKYESESTMDVVIDPDKRILMVYSTSEDEEGNVTETAIYDGYQIRHTIYEGGGEYYYYSDIEDEIDEFFDAYEPAEKLDWEELFDLIDDNTDGEASDYLNRKDAIKCAKAYMKKLNSTRWLKENAGFSTERENGVKLYKFDPKPYKFLSASLECFEDAFEDEDDYEDLMDELKDNKSDINDTDISFAFGIKGGKLVSLEMENEGGYSDSTITLEFTNIGTATIDEDDMADLLSEAKQYEKEHDSWY